MLDFAVAGGPGFEPGLEESESTVLPLNYPPISSQPSPSCVRTARRRPCCDQRLQVSAGGANQSDAAVAAESNEAQNGLLSRGGQTIDVRDIQHGPCVAAEDRSGRAQLLVQFGGSEGGEPCVCEGGEMMQGLGDGVRTAALFAGEERDAKVRSQETELGPKPSNRGTGPEEYLRVAEFCGGLRRDDRGLEPGR